jgi:hypothetical protein
MPAGEDGCMNFVDNTGQFGHRGAQFRVLNRIILAWSLYREVCIIVREAICSALWSLVFWVCGIICSAAKAVVTISLVVAYDTRAPSFCRPL